MINAVIGDILTVSEQEVIMRCAHLEYRIAITAHSATLLSNLSAEARKGVRVLTVLLHRDDAMLLVGFLDRSEREAFLQLQTVSGIGFKQALKILSGISVTHLAQALDSGNVKMLATIPGVGPKTAQKMVLALRNVLVIDDDLGAAAPRRGASSKWSDIINALIDMGYERRRVEEVIAALTEERAAEIASLDMHQVEQLLFSQAIKLLG
jgi:Holliday junction DNA helicase RuvA